MPTDRTPPDAAEDRAPDIRTLVHLTAVLALAPAVFRLLALGAVGVPQFTVAETVRAGDVLAAVLVGTAQDLVVAGALLAAVVLVARRGRIAGALALTAIFLATHLYYLLDLLLYRSRRIRMSATFLEFFKFPQSFLDSAWDAGLAWLVLGSAVLVGTAVGVAWMALRLLRRPPPLTRPLTLGWVGLALATVVGAELLPRPSHYASSNIIFRDVFRTLYDREGRWRTPSDVPSEGAAVAALLPPNETARSLDPAYPLLREVTGFEGETHFDPNQPGGERPHVVILFMESLSARDVGALGAPHRPSPTPELDALAQQGALHTAFYTPGVQTTRAVVAGLFGIPPRFSRRAVQSEEVDYPLVGIQDVLADAGYRTAYLHNGNLSFEAQTEFFGAHGFEEIRGDDEMAAHYPEAPRSSWGIPDEYLMREIVDWLTAREADGEQGFVTAFSMTNHHPWVTPPGWAPAGPLPEAPGEYGRHLGTVAYSDWALGQLIDGLREAELDGRVVLFVLGDTGNPMGEHDDNFMLVRHLYEPGLRVPLVIWAPGRIEGPVRLDEPGSQMDIPATVMDVLDIGGVTHGIGTSMRRVAPDRLVYLTNPFHLRLRGLRSGKWKYIASEAAEREALYDLAVDPGERVDVSAANPAVTAELRERTRWVAQAVDRLWAERGFAPEARQGAEPARGGGG